MNGRKGAVLLVIAAAIGGFGFVAMKTLLDGGYAPMQCVALRYAVAVGVMCVFYFKEIRRITSNELKGGAAMGCFLFMLFFLLMEGLKRTTPSVNAFLSCTTAVIVPFIVWAVFKRRPDIYTSLGAAMAVVGVAALSLTDGLEISIGAALSFGAAIMFAIQIVVMDIYVKDCDPVHLTIVESITVLIFSLIFSLIRSENFKTPSLLEFFMIIIAGVFCTFLYFLFQSIGQKSTSPTGASIIITSESVFAAISSALFYGENVGLRTIFGGTMIFLAVIIAEVKPRIPAGIFNRPLTYKQK